VSVDNEGAAQDLASGAGEPSAPGATSVPGVTSVPGPSAGARRLIAGVVAVIGFTIWTIHGVRQWQTLWTPSWDLGIFTQAVKAYAHLQPPVVPIKGPGYLLLGDHFSPLLVVLAPLYRVWPSAFALLVAQAALLAWSAAVLTGDAVRALGRVNGAVVGAAYLLSFGVIQAVAFQFHEVALAVPLLALALVHARRRQWGACVAWALPLVLVKEDLGLTVAALGVVLWVMRAPRRYAVALGAGGIGAFVLVLWVLIPWANTRGWAYGGLLDVEALRSQPWRVVTGLVDAPEKRLTLALLLGAGGVVAVRSPLVLAAVPTLLWRFWSGHSSYWSFIFHYDLVLMPVMTAALIDGVHRLRGIRAGSRWGRLTAGGSWLARLAPAVALVVAVGFLPQTALAAWATPQFWAPSPRAEAAAQVLALIPDGVVVETDTGLLNYLVDRTTVTYVGVPGNPVPDVLLLDRAAGWGSDPGSAAAYAEGQHPGVHYVDIADVGGYRLAQRMP